MKYKPWTGCKENSYGGIENSNENIIKLWEDFVNDIIQSGNRPHNYLQIEIDNYLNNRENIEINRGNEDNLVYEAYDNDDVVIGNKNDDWMEGAHDMQYIAEQNIDDMNDVEIRWDKTNDFSSLHHEYDVNIDVNDITRKYDEILKSERIVNRRDVCKTRLNIKQRMAHDLIIRAMNLVPGQSKTDGGDDVS